MIFVTLSLVWGCASIDFSKLPVQHPVPDSGIKIEGDKILHNGQLFAELRYYFTSRRSENLGEAYMFSAEIQHRGLAIYYQNENQLIWIFPKEGRAEDVERGYFRARGQTDGYVGWVYDVRISDDGRYVYYKKPGLMTQSSYVFSIEHAVSKKIESVK